MAPLQNRMWPESNNRMGQGADAAVGGALMRPGPNNHADQGAMNGAPTKPHTAGSDNRVGQGAGAAAGGALMCSGPNNHAGQGAMNGAPTKPHAARNPITAGQGAINDAPTKPYAPRNPMTAWARVPVPPQGAHSCAPDRSPVSFNPVRRRLTVENGTPNAR